MQNTHAGQSRAASLFETVLSTILGLAVAVGTQLAIFPIFDIAVSLDQNLLIAAIFTAVSILRGYLVRRLFNFLHIVGVLK